MERQPIPKEGRLALGRCVRVKAQVLPRKSEWHRAWRRSLFRGGLTECDEVEGIIAGIRTVYEGATNNLGDDGLEWEPSKAIQVYLVALSMARTVRALPEDVTPIDG